MIVGYNLRNNKSLTNSEFSQYENILQQYLVTDICYFYASELPVHLEAGVPDYGRRLCGQCPYFCLPRSFKGAGVELSQDIRVWM